MELEHVLGIKADLKKKQENCMITRIPIFRHRNHLTKFI